MFLKKIRAYGDPRLFALNLLTEQMARSQQPLVPERVLMMGGDGQDGGVGGRQPVRPADGAAAGREGRHRRRRRRTNDPADVEQFVDGLTGHRRAGAAPAASAHA